VAGRRYYQFRRERHYWLQYTEWWVRPHLLHFSALSLTMENELDTIGFSYQRNNICLVSINAGMFFRAKFWNMRSRMKLTEISAFEPAMPSLRSPQNELTVIDTKLLG
jgi:hypothetical protein